MDNENTKPCKYISEYDAPLCPMCNEQNNVDNKEIRTTEIWNTVVLGLKNTLTTINNGVNAEVSTSAKMANNNTNNTTNHTNNISNNNKKIRFNYDTRKWEGITNDTIWYPDEGICRLRRFATLTCVRRQKEIQRRTEYRDFYFTKSDLEKIRRITNKCKGRNPDKDITQCHTQNTPEFNKKHLDKVGVFNTTTTLTSSAITDDQNPVKTPIRRD